jgi:CRP-like cAMP-binding protein
MPMIKAASDSFVAPLLRVPVFQDLTERQLIEIARKAERVMFRIGQPVIKAGDAGDGAYLIIVGDAERREPGLSVEQSYVETGSLVGEMAMLVDTEYSTTVIAKSAIRALKITRAALYAQMERDPDLAAHFVAKVASRLRAFTEELRRIEAGLDVQPDLSELALPHAMPLDETRHLAAAG